MLAAHVVIPLYSNESDVEIRVEYQKPDDPLKVIRHLINNNDVSNEPCSKVCPDSFPDPLVFDRL